MKVEIERGVFAEIVGGAARALAVRPAAPVLAGMLLTADARAGTLCATAFDFEFAVRATGPARVGEAGVALVSGRLLAEITRVLPDVPVELVLEDGHLVLGCGAYRYTLACMPVPDYPTLPGFPPVIGTVGGAALTTAASRAAMAAERDDTLPFLTGTRLEFGAARLRLVATDRYRLSRVEVPWHPGGRPSGASAPAPQPPEALVAALVPARALLEAAKLLPAAEQVSIGLGEGLLGLSAGRLELTLRQLDGEFIRYAQLFPQEYAGEARFEVAPLTEAIRAIALVAERNSAVRLKLAPGRVRVSAGTGDQALADVTLEVEYAGEPVVIAANPAYLLDGLGALGTPYARLRYPAKLRPVFLSPWMQPGAKQDATGGALFDYLFIPQRSGERS